MTAREWPSISVVMPIRNEAAFIARSLGAMCAQNYPGEVEILCVDGMSDDGTREIISRMAANDERIRLIDNPKRTTPTALNIGIHEARHDLVARMDGHTIAPPDYLQRCVEILIETRADCVGGRWEYVSETFIAGAIAAAIDSRFGVGTAQWRGAKTAGETDTVPFGLWRRERMLALGGFDETLVRNQDYEFNYRLRAAGGHIYYSPEIVSTYYSRQGLGTLWRQYFQYGLWKARVLQIHPDSFRWRHGAAPLFVAGLVVGAILSLFGGLWRLLYGAALLVYLALAAFFSIRQAARHGWRYLPLIPLVFVILHVAWGMGFWVGVWRWWLRGEGKHASEEP
jgi:succinoglycan biosynthesis protein ExoA